MSQERIAIAHEMIARYNAQDLDGYAALMTDDACEALYRGAVLGEGKEGVCAALAAVFAKFPENRAEIFSSHAAGGTVVLHERVTRSPGGDQFEVISIYSFEGDKVSRVEFIR